MSISVFDLFKIGIGPSSSHTVGPMKAALKFVEILESKGLLNRTERVKVDLYGSLALTGHGHATDLACLLGLEGNAPSDVDPNIVIPRTNEIRNAHKINLLHKHEIPFNESEDLIFHMDKQLPYHPNGMRFTAFDAKKEELTSDVYYSVGGGFIIDHASAMKDAHLVENSHKDPYPFKTADELLNLCHKHNLTIGQLMMENEKSWRTEGEIKTGLLKIWRVMQDCVERGCREDGVAIR